MSHSSEVVRSGLVGNCLLGATGGVALTWESGPGAVAGAAVGCVAGMMFLNCDGNPESHETVGGQDAGASHDAGTTVPQRDGGSDGGVVAPPRASHAAVIETDFANPTGSLHLLDLDESRFLSEPVFTTNNDAAVRHFSVREFNNRLYVVNRFGGDSVQCLDLTTEETVEFPMGGGTNPQDIALVSATKAYVSLYAPTEPGDVAVINPSTGEVAGRIDLMPYAENNDGHAEASSMVLVNSGGRLYNVVAVQDLDGFSATTAGKLVWIDTETDEVVHVTTLRGRNPFALAVSHNAVSADEETILISNAGNFNPDDEFGGIEAVDVASKESLGIMIDDRDIGGTVGDIETSPDWGFVVTNASDFSHSNIVRFGLNPVGGAQMVYPGSGALSDIAWAEAVQSLLVGDRSQTPGILFLDSEGVVKGRVPSVMAPPASITVY